MSDNKSNHLLFLFIQWVFMDQLSDPMPLLILFLFFLLGSTATKKAWGSLAQSFQIRSGWNLARFFLDWTRIDWRSRISADMTSHFQDGGRDVISRKTSSPPRHWLAVCATVPDPQYICTCWLSQRCYSYTTVYCGLHERNTRVYPQ